MTAAFRSSTAPTSTSTRSIASRPRPDASGAMLQEVAGGLVVGHRRQAFLEKAPRAGRIVPGERLDARLQEVAGPGLGGALLVRIALEYFENGDRPGLALDHHDVDGANVVGPGIGQLLPGVLRD